MKYSYTTQFTVILIKVKQNETASWETGLTFINIIFKSYSWSVDWGSALCTTELQISKEEKQIQPVAAVTSAAK